MRCVCLLGLALFGLGGCGPTKAEVAQAIALRRAQDDAANERAGAAFVESWRVQHRPSLEVPPLTPPRVLNSRLDVGVGAAAFGAAVLGATFSNTRGLY
jgi:hypothetical protein